MDAILNCNAFWIWHIFYRLTFFFLKLVPFHAVAFQAHSLRLQHCRYCVIIWCSWFRKETLSMIYKQMPQFFMFQNSKNNQGMALQILSGVNNLKMNLINTLTKLRKARPPLYFRNEFKLGADKDEQQILKQYNKKVEQIQKMPNGDAKKNKFDSLVSETQKRLKALEKQKELKKVKDYLSEGLTDQRDQIKKQPNKQDEDRGYIPINLVIKKLKFLDKKIFLLGVEQQNEDHCIYLKQIAEKLGSKIILTALPPDMPYFIKTQLSFVQEWKKFITNPNYAKESKFYINPSPHHISEFCLGKAQIQLVRNNLSKSREFNQIFYTIMQRSKRLNRFLPNALLTPLLINSVEKIYFCDYPVLKERQLWAMSIPLEKLRNLFAIYHKQVYRNKKMIFDPRILFPQEIIGRKFQHMANAVKYSSHQSKQPVIFVCPAEYVEMFCMEFKKDKPVRQFSNLSYGLPQIKQTTFIDFVEKLVLMDLMLEPIIQKYFVENLSFPYTAQQTLGGKENIGKIFMVWKHYMSMYQNVLNEQPKS